MITSIAEAAKRDVSRETYDGLAEYVRLLKMASEGQNLIAASTVEMIWDRHVLDSAQLVRFEPHRGAAWVDIGSGAGLPGIVIALLVNGPVTLVEPRSLRVQFLQQVVDALGIGRRVTIHHGKAAGVSGSFDIITARAVAPLSRLFELSSHLSTKKTVWALPKGRTARTELAEAQRAWQGAFHVEQSVTDEDSYIIVASGVGKKP